MPTHAGPCRALITRWYYDKHEETCRSFTWGGCDGNDNNFASDIDCYIACDSQYDNPPNRNQGNDYTYFSYDYKHFAVMYSYGCLGTAFHMVKTCMYFPYDYKHLQSCIHMGVWVLHFIWKNLHVFSI